MVATKPASEPPPPSDPTPLSVEALAIYDAVIRGEHVALKPARVPS